MLTDFDLHIPTGRLALRRVRERIPEIVVTDIISGELLTRVPQQFLPQTPRFSPDGKLLACAGNGRIHLHSIETGMTETIVDLSDHHAGFASWSPNGRYLAFSAHAVPVSRSSPPRIFRVGVTDGKSRFKAQRKVVIVFHSGARWEPNWRSAGIYDTPEPYDAIVLRQRAPIQQQVPISLGGSILPVDLLSPDDRRLLVTEKGRTTRAEVFDATDISPYGPFKQTGPSADASTSGTESLRSRGAA